MKTTLLTAVAAAALSAAALTAMPAAAQTAPSWYGNLGYSAVDGDGGTLGAVGGRVGARLHPNFGVEGEAGFGIKSDDVNVAGTNVESKLKHSVGVYAVGYVPMSENFDLIGRVGVGQSKTEASAPGVKVSSTDESWNYGVGAQYTFDGVNGIRGDWTRHDFNGDAGKADAYTISYVRKF